MNLLHEVVHERLQRYIVGKNGLSCLRADATIGTSSVGGRRVQLGQQETCLGTTSIAHNESGKREAVGNKILVSISMLHHLSLRLYNITYPGILLGLLE